MNMRTLPGRPRGARAPGKRAWRSRRGATAVLAAIALVLTGREWHSAAPKGNIRPRRLAWISSLVAWRPRRSRPMR